MLSLWAYLAWGPRHSVTAAPPVPEGKGCECGSEVSPCTAASAGKWEGGPGGRRGDFTGQGGEESVLV